MKQSSANMTNEPCIDKHPMVTVLIVRDNNEGTNKVSLYLEQKDALAAAAEEIKAIVKLDDIYGVQEWQHSLDLYLGTGEYQMAIAAFNDATDAHDHVIQLQYHRVK